MAKLFRNIALMAIGVIVVLQFIPVDRSNPEVVKSNDFLVSNATPDDVATIMKGACYDCHSHETVWPWYAYAAPVSWVVSDHVKHAREELNFSEWTAYPVDRADHKLEECVEAITEGFMPEEGYVTMHEEARLTDVERKKLVDYFTQVRAELGYVGDGGDHQEEEEEEEDHEDHDLHEDHDNHENHD